jgi:hypothetical protein
MNSKKRSKRLDLESGLPTTERDSAALRALRYPKMTDAEYVRFLAILTPSDHSALAAKRGPRGTAFRLRRA